jgi:hypothetical protein
MLRTLRCCACLLIDSDHDRFPPNVIPAGPVMALRGARYRRFPVDL